MDKLTLEEIIRLKELAIETAIRDYMEARELADRPVTEEFARQKMTELFGEEVQ